jgi:RNA polymerase-binding transcription factor DksA
MNSESDKERAAPGPSAAGGGKNAIDPVLLDSLRTLLLRRRAVAIGDLRGLEQEACSKGTEASGDLSALPSHAADLASDTYEQDFSLGLLETKSVEIREVEEALERIEAGTFGLCEGCRESIPAARLQAIPYARLCLECKKKEEAP